MQAASFEEAIEQIAAQDRTHDLTFGNVWDLPFGRNRAFLKNAHGVGEAVLGNWKLNSVLNCVNL